MLLSSSLTPAISPTLFAGKKKKHDLEQPDNAKGFVLKGIEKPTTSDNNRRRVALKHAFKAEVAQRKTDLEKDIAIFKQLSEIEPNLPSLQGSKGYILKPEPAEKEEKYSSGKVIAFVEMLLPRNDAKKKPAPR
jgi:hypothetical protein